MTRTAVCIGGGASVTQEDLRAVERAQAAGACVAIAINSSFHGAPWAEVVYGADEKWWYANIQALCRYTGRAISSSVLPRPWGVQHLRVTGIDGFDPEPDCVRSGRGSGYQALHFAMRWFDRVVLLGYDMAGGHWHGGYRNEPPCDYASTMLPCFETLVEPAQARGVDVVNCSPRSAIQCFPKAQLSTLL